MSASAAISGVPADPLLEPLLTGDRRALAQAITLIESTRSDHRARADALLAELRGLGGNLHPQRHAGLRTPRWRHRLQQALGELALQDGRPALRFELVYGHAFKPQPRARMAAVTRLSADTLRMMARTRPGGPPRG